MDRDSIVARSIAPTRLARRFISAFVCTCLLPISLAVAAEKPVPVPEVLRDQAETLIRSAVAAELAKLKLTSPPQKTTVNAGVFRVNGQARSQTRFVDPQKNLRLKVQRLDRVGLQKLLATVKWSCPTASQIQYSAPPLRGRLNAVATAAATMTFEIEVQQKGDALECTPKLTSLEPEVTNVKVANAPPAVNALAEKAANAAISANKPALNKLAGAAVGKAVAAKPFRVKLSDLLN